MQDNPTPDFTGCPYWGIGGRYVVDPVTGRRTPDPAPDAPAQAPEASAEQPAENPAKKGR